MKKTEKTRKTRSGRGGAKRRRTVLFQDGLGALSVAAFLFLGATIREVNLLMALGSFFAGFAVLDYWQGRRSLRRLRVVRRLPDAVFAGRPFDVEIEIDATRRRSSAWGIVVEDEWTRQESERDLFASPKREGIERTEKTGKTFGGVAAQKEENEGRFAGNEGDRVNRKNGKKAKKSKDRRNAKKTGNGEVAQEEARPNVVATTRPTAYFPRVKGGERRRERYCGVVARRGVRRLATLTASTRFPFGFFRSSERFDAPDEILVFPKIGVLTERWNAEFGVARREATVSTARTSRIAGETLTVRDWRPDDSKRAIHWRATAKRDKLQARDFEKRDNSVKMLILDLFFDKNNENGRGFNFEREQNDEFKADAQNGTFGEKKKKAQNREDARKAKEASGIDAFESAWRLTLVEKAVSFAATLVERWTRSNDAKLLLAINGDEAVSSGKNDVSVNGGKPSDAKRFAKAKKTENLGGLGDLGAWGGRVESGSGAFRRALTRLATAETPRRDRLAEIAASLDPRVLANAQVFIVSVAPLDAARLTGNESKTGGIGKTDSGGKAERLGETETLTTAQGIGGRWRDARTVDVSATDFDDYFEF